jgi:hypothetical protein
MRKQVYISDMFNRDTSWITQEMCEEYAIEMRRGRERQEFCARKMCQGDARRMLVFREVLDTNPDLQDLGDEIIAELGGAEAVFGRVKTEYETIKDLERLAENETDAEIKVKYYALILKAKGMEKKDSGKAVTVNVNQPGAITVATLDPKEAERIAMSIFG